MEEMNTTNKKIHIVVIPYPVQGHINPMLQFSKRLASKNNITVTLIATTKFTQSLQSPNSNSTINIEKIPDGFQEHEKPNSIEEFVDRFKALTSHLLPDLIRKLGVTVPVKAVVYDSFMPWILEISRDLGILAGSFFTHSCAVSAIYYHTSNGDVRRSRIGDGGDGGELVLPALPVMGVGDLPSFVSDRDSYPAVLKLVLDRFSNFRDADWLFFNTFDLLEEELVKWMGSQWPVKTIGPTVPSMYLDKLLPDDKDYGLTLFKSDAEACTSWLDTKKPSSVVYVSFGSLASHREGQMDELASAFMKTNFYFLWVVRDSEASKLPRDLLVNDLERKILVVNWCPQLDVLAHPAVGCFMTHSGWNSTLEGLSLGVPMVTLPQWADQPTNAKYVVDLWGAGVRVKGDERGIYRREEIERCIKQVMEGEKENVIRNNVARWKNWAIEAMGEGGSSDKNINDFIAKLACT